MMLALACAIGWVAQCAQAQTAAGESIVLNPHSPAYGHPYRHGVVPSREAHQDMQLWRALNASASTVGTQTLSYGGGLNGAGVTSGTPRVYLVVYGNQWGTAGTDANGNMTLSRDAVGAVPYLQRLFQGLGTAGELWSGTMTQYCDGAGVSAGATMCPSTSPKVGYPNGTTLAGIWYDNSVASPDQATAAQLAQEAANAAAHFGNTGVGSNRYAQYVILSPSGAHPDGFNTSGGNFCAWHSYTTASSGNVAYTNMPYVSDMGASCGANFVNAGSAGSLDGFSIVEGHEYAETVTDQFPSTGWINHTGSSYNGEEDGDECAWLGSGQGAAADVSMGTGSFAMQSTWSNDTNRCDISHPVVVVQTGVGTLSASPSSVSMSASGGAVAMRTVTITNSGPGTLSAIGADLTLISGGGVSEMGIGSDACTGATLSPGGACTIKLVFSSGCLPNSSDFSRWNLAVNGTVATSVLNVSVTGTTTKGLCR